MTFAKGAGLKDPSGVFISSLDGSHPRCSGAKLQGQAQALASEPQADRLLTSKIGGTHTRKTSRGLRVWIN